MKEINVNEWVFVNNHILGKFSDTQDALGDTLESAFLGLTIKLIDAFELTTHTQQVGPGQFARGTMITPISEFKAPVIMRVKWESLILVKDLTEGDKKVIEHMLTGALQSREEQRIERDTKLVLKQPGQKILLG